MLRGRVALLGSHKWNKCARCGRPFDLFGWSMPRRVPKNLDRVLWFHGIHEIGAWCLIGLIALHALFHHFV